MSQPLDLSVDTAQPIFSGSRKRILKPTGTNDLAWVDFPTSNPSPESGLQNSAACIFSAFLFEQLANKQLWQQLPMWSATSTYRLDWLNRRFDHLIFSHLLCEHGMPTHFQSLVDCLGKTLSPHEPVSPQQLFLQVALAAQPHLPTVEVCNHKLYLYPASFKQFPAAVPLKIKYYLQLEPDQPLSQRLKQDPSYARCLGLQLDPGNPKLPRPVLEMYTSQEADERLLSIQEALTLSALTPGQFEELVEMSYCAALALAAIFSRRGLQISEGTLQYCLSKEGLVLIDTLSFHDMTLLNNGLKLNPFYGVPGLVQSLTNQLTGHDYFASPPLAELLRESGLLS